MDKLLRPSNFAQPILKRPKIVTIASSKGGFFVANPIQGKNPDPWDFKFYGIFPQKSGIPIRKNTKVTKTLVILVSEISYSSKTKIIFPVFFLRFCWKKI